MAYCRCRSRCRAVPSHLHVIARKAVHNVRQVRRPWIWRGCLAPEKGLTRQPSKRHYSQIPSLHNFIKCFAGSRCLRCPLPFPPFENYLFIFILFFLFFIIFVILCHIFLVFFLCLGVKRPSSLSQLRFPLLLFRITILSGWSCGSV